MVQEAMEELLERIVIQYQQLLLILIFHPNKHLQILEMVGMVQEQQALRVYAAHKVPTDSFKSNTNSTHEQSLPMTKPRCTRFPLRAPDEGRGVPSRAQSELRDQ